MSHSQSTRTPITISSQKRSRADITRSGSRTSSIEPLIKRRRVHRTPLPSPIPTPSSVPTRHERDGLDFRRPAMSNAANYVDLTGDDDEGSFTEAFDANNDDFLLDEYWLGEQRERSTTGNTGQNHDPPAQGPRNLLPNFIDLSSDDEPTYARPQEVPPDRGLRRASTSSEVVFVSERPATPPVNPALNSRRPSLRDRRPTPGPHRDRRQPPNMAAPPPLPGLRTLGNIQGFIRRAIFRQEQQMWPEPPNLPAPAVLPDDLEIIDFNYGHAAFPMGDRGSETPQGTPGDAYKEPEPIPEGFAGDIDEDGVYVCPLCDEELATGLSEEKQQVWVAKQCGHVYCGGCARRRPVKTGTKKDKRGDFKMCVVDGCGVKVDSKGAMIQVYL